MESGWEHAIAHLPCVLVSTFNANEAFAFTMSEVSLTMIRCNAEGVSAGRAHKGVQLQELALPEEVLRVFPGQGALFQHVQARPRSYCRIFIRQDIV